MTKSKLEQLIDRYLQGVTTDEETKLVEDFYRKMIFQETERDESEESDQEEIGKRLYQKIEKKIRKNPHGKWYRIPAAAAILILMIMAFLYWGQEEQVQEISNVEIEKIISAGSGQRSVLLSDGTYILLNPGATLTYPLKFTNSRKVSLTGEAWFDVQPDDHLPFHVITDEITTTVLGTSFQINTNPETSKVEVKVTSGRVQVSAQDKEIAVLEKDEQLEYQAGTYKIERESPVSDMTTLPLPEPGSWKLANITMGEAVSFIEKRWNTTIEFENMEIRDCPLYASFNADDTMEDVLMILCEVSHSKYRQEEGAIKIYGQGCNIKRAPME